MMRSHRPPLTPLLLASIAIAAIGVACVLDGERIIYNGTGSMPRGFYLRQNSPVERGAIVTVRALDAAPAEARRRGFTDANDRFLKRVAAVEGDAICAVEGDILVNGRIVARRRTQDSDGRALSAWHGCFQLMPGELLLLGEGEDSFDGRYWGALTRDKIEGVWSALAL